MRTNLNDIEKALYRRWADMRNRCNNPNNTAYKHYGGRGISVCERWESFDNFKLDMGSSFDPKLTIERVDVNGDYNLENCTWVSMKTQCRNRRTSVKVVYEGEDISICDLAEKFDIKPQTLYNRVKILNMSIKDALNHKPWDYTEGTRTKLYYTYRGITKSHKEWSEEIGVSVGTFTDRVMKEYPEEIIMSSKNIFYLKKTPIQQQVYDTLVSMEGSRIYHLAKRLCIRWEQCRDALHGLEKKGYCFKHESLWYSDQTMMKTSRAGY